MALTYERHFARCFCRDSGNIAWQYFPHNQNFSRRFRWQHAHSASNTPLGYSVAYIVYPAVLPIKHLFSKNHSMQKEDCALTENIRWRTALFCFDFQLLRVSKVFLLGHTCHKPCRKRVYQTGSCNPLYRWSFGLKCTPCQGHFKKKGFLNICQ